MLEYHINIIGHDRLVLDYSSLAHVWRTLGDTHFKGNLGLLIPPNSTTKQILYRQHQGRLFPGTVRRNQYNPPVYQQEILPLLAFEMCTSMLYSCLIKKVKIVLANWRSLIIPNWARKKDLHMLRWSVSWPSLYDSVYTSKVPESKW